MIVIDANVWVSALLPHDRFHASSQPYIDTLLHTGVLMVVPTLFLTEVSASIARQTTPADGQRARIKLRAIDVFRWITVDDALADAAADFGAELQLRGADSIYVTIAHQLGVPLISWDNDHLTRAIQRITVYTPETAPHP
jgi:predicted nucleic acid-binding protein